MSCKILIVEDETIIAVEEACPNCGTVRPAESPYRSRHLRPIEYGSFAMFCLRLTWLFSFLCILGSIVCFFATLINWDGFGPLLFTLLCIPISIGTFLAISIAIRYAEEKNAIR